MLGTCPDLAVDAEEPTHERRRRAWEGVDKTVIEKVATEAGHPPREPYINTDQGDLLLFLFLLAGAIGGFIVGYAFRALFPPRKRPLRATKPSPEHESTARHDHASPSRIVFARMLAATAACWPAATSACG